MSLTLRITNMTTLPDGGATEHSTHQGRFEIGRDPGMDWTLPDPNRFVSSCHAEVRWENGAYWLYDVSTNGTFVNGASMRVKSPYQIQNGDKIQFGQYITEASVNTQATGSAMPGTAPGGDAFGGDAGLGAPFGAPPSGDPFGAAAPGGSFGGAPSGQDPFTADPFAAPGGGRGSSGAGFARGDDPFGGGGAFGAEPGHHDGADDPWAIAGVPSADSDAFGAPAPPLSAGDAGNELIQMDFGNPATSPSALDSHGSASPFGGGAGDASPFGAAPQTAPPGSAQEAPPARTGHADSPFGAPQPSGAQAAPPPFGAANPGRGGLPPGPPSEGFGAPTPRPQPHAAPTPPAPTPAAQPGAAGASDAAVLRAICEGAGMRPDAFNGVDATTAGYEIGQALRVVAAELASLLRVRSEGKQRYERTSRTMIGRDANNPLKFIPTANEALEIMFASPRQGYLRGAQTMQTSFNDIKRHQYAVQAALQPALARLLEDLSPEAIEHKVGATRFGSKSARAWDLFVERWDAKTHPYENGMLDVFQAYFSEAYHDASKGS